MISNFQLVLDNALTPITLITGVGLIKLCMVNRYAHCTDRIRALIQEREESGLTEDPNLDHEILLLFKRCRLLRYSMLFLAFSAVSAGLLIATNLIATFFHYHFQLLSAFWLGAALGLMVLSTLTLTVEVGISLNALKLLVRHLPPSVGRRNPQ